MDITKQQQLKKHKRIATGLFIFMALLYILMIYLLKNNNQEWMNYVKAFSEAGMVGALADWFAVTALFKYPLGIKIPHTNLINNNKDSLGKNLGSFVSENFLNSETIRPYIQQINITSYIQKWLSSTKNQDKVKFEIQNIIRNILARIDDREIALIISNKGKEIIKGIKIENLASKGLFYAIENNEHNRLITLILPQAKSYVENNKEAIYQKVVEKNPILGLVGGKAVTNQLISGIIAFIEDIQNNGGHKIRNEITEKLIEITEDIKTDVEWKNRFNNLKQDFITNEKVESYASNLWINTKTSILKNLDVNDGLFNKYIEKYLLEISSNIESDTETQNKINKSVQQFVYKLALKNSNEIGNIISRTVKEWDGKELSEKLELEVGKDLQYIRINGTLVGGMVGLIIYTVTHLIS